MSYQTKKTAAYLHLKSIKQQKQTIRGRTNDSLLQKFNHPHKFLHNKDKAAFNYYRPLCICVCECMLIWMTVYNALWCPPGVVLSCCIFCSLSVGQGCFYIVSNVSHEFSMPPLHYFILAVSQAWTLFLKDCSPSPDLVYSIVCFCSLCACSNAMAHKVFWARCIFMCTGTVV